MTVTITVGAQNRLGAIRSGEILSGSTASAFQLINVTDDISYLNASTATAGFLNAYVLTDGTPGQVKWIGFGTHATATGIAGFISVTGTTATGATNLFTYGTATDDSFTREAATGYFHLQQASDLVMLRFSDSEWQVEQIVGATIFTST